MMVLKVATPYLAQIECLYFLIDPLECIKNASNQLRKIKATYFQFFCLKNFKLAVSKLAAKIVFGNDYEEQYGSFLLNLSLLICSI